jgi:hypothetical protein
MKSVTNLLDEYTDLPAFLGFCILNAFEVREEEESPTGFSSQFLHISTFFQCDSAAAFIAPNRTVSANNLSPFFSA